MELGRSSETLVSNHNLEDLYLNLTSCHLPAFGYPFRVMLIGFSCATDREHVNHQRKNKRTCEYLPVFVRAQH